jgi:hypothetical protein
MNENEEKKPTHKQFTEPNGTQGEICVLTY